MATAISPTPMKGRIIDLPPKRGQIKAQIFESLINSVVSAVSKGKTGGVGGISGDSASAFTTPPARAYNYDTNNDIGMP